MDLVLGWPVDTFSYNNTSGLPLEVEKLKDLEEEEEGQERNLVNLKIQSRSNLENYLLVD